MVWTVTIIKLMLLACVYIIKHIVTPKIDEDAFKNLYTIRCVLTTDQA